ncbi:hypothetical protein CONPUDRAFT_34306, partial [Coniophora puteana RWD-64-598 SS2]
DSNCFLCGKSLRSDESWLHSGGHILKAMQGVIEDDLCEKVSIGHACGFCGKPSCASVRLEKTSTGRYTIESQCPRFHILQLASARKFSKATPCTNVPVQCMLCS